MSEHVLPSMIHAQRRASAWGAVVAVALGAFALVASEFMPVSLLTPLASDLRISEGTAGQAISISGAFALVTSLFISSLSGRLDRKPVMLSLTALMLVSGTTVAFAPSVAVFMAGRALIGVAIGGFWSMSAATVMRLVQTEQVPRALAIVNGGNALATVIAAPVGSFLGTIVGWRWAFFCTVPIAAAALAWQWASLPHMPVHHRKSSRTTLEVFKLFERPAITLGMVAVSLLFMGQFALFTYLRPFLESVTQVSASALSFMLLVIGVSGFLGTVLIGKLLRSSVYPVLVVMPLIMALTAFGLVMFGDSKTATITLLALWGCLGTAAPVGWWTWLARTLPHDAEVGGGLMVAVIQLAIALGALVGGVAFDAIGHRATFGLSAILLALAAVAAAWTSRAARRTPDREA